MQRILASLLILMATQAQAGHVPASDIPDQYFYVFRLVPVQTAIAIPDDYGKSAFRNELNSLAAKLTAECGARVDVWDTALLGETTRQMPVNSWFAFLASGDSADAARGRIPDSPCSQDGYIVGGTITLPASFRLCVGPDDGSAEYATLCK